MRLFSNCEYPGSGMVPSKFGDDSNLGGGNCYRLTVWLGSSVGRIFAQYTRDRGSQVDPIHVLNGPW